MKRVLFAAVLACLAVAAVAAPSGYKVTGRIDSPGATTWGNLTYDAKRHRLFLPQRTDTMIIDTESKKVVGKIEYTPKSHGVALANDLNLGFSGISYEDHIEFFELDTLKKVGSVKVDHDPQLPIYVPGTNRVLSFDDRSRNVSVIDIARKKVVSRIALGGPVGQAVVGTKGRVFVPVMGDNALIVIDPVKGRQVARMPFTECRLPYALAVDPQGRLYTACRDGRLVVFSPDGKVIAHLAISSERTGQGIGGAVFQDGHLFVSNGRDSNIVVVDETQPGRWEVVEIIPTERGARGLVGDPDNHRLYSVTADVDPASPKDRPRAKADTLHVIVIERS